jgi:hypothetical protein
MAENKTKPTDASVEDYILSRASEQQRTDSHELMALLEKVTQDSPKMWGPSICYPWPPTGGVLGCGRRQTEVLIVQAW